MLRFDIDEVHRTLSSMQSCRGRHGRGLESSLEWAQLRVAVANIDPKSLTNLDVTRCARSRATLRAVKRLLVLSVILDLACTSSAGEQPSKQVSAQSEHDAPQVASPNEREDAEPNAEEPSEADVALMSKAIEVWSHMAETENGCADVYDYFPDGGMRIFWCHLETLVSYPSLVEASGIQPFLSGPHTNTTLNLASEASFGHYNPAFVQWMVKYAIPARDVDVARLQPIYDKFMQDRGRLYYAAMLHLERNPDYLREQVEWLDAYLAHQDRARPLDHYDDITPDEWINEYPPAIAFWVRRAKDGTFDGFKQGITKLLTTYDPVGKAEMEARTYTVPESEAKAEMTALPFSGSSLDVAVKNAWAVFADRSPEVACPDQFEYDPGGARVQYCRAASILNYATLQNQITMPIFQEGPHRPGQLDLENNRSFGHYNPAFLEWAINHVVPAATDPEFRRLTQPGYDRHLRVPVRVFMLAWVYLSEHPKKKAQMLEEYRTWINAGEAVNYYQWGETLVSQLEGSKAPYYEIETIGGTASAFWLRRSMDKTDQPFFVLLTKVMKAYDGRFLNAIEAKTHRNPELYKLVSDQPGVEDAQAVQMSWVADGQETELTVDAFVVRPEAPDKRPSVLRVACRDAEKTMVAVVDVFDGEQENPEATLSLNYHTRLPIEPQVCEVTLFNDAGGLLAQHCRSNDGTLSNRGCKPAFSSVEAGSTVSKEALSISRPSWKAYTGVKPHSWDLALNAEVRVQGAIDQLTDLRAFGQCTGQAEEELVGPDEPWTLIEDVHWVPQNASFMVSGQTVGYTEDRDSSCTVRVVGTGSAGPVDVAMWCLEGESIREGACDG